MVNCAIYARFSTDRQNERSVDDQVHICLERAKSSGWSVEQVFSDYAITGTIRDRPGLNALLASAGNFDIILAEDLDRISRDQEDIAHIYKVLTFAGSKMHTLADGEISEFHIGVKGAMSAVFIKNLGDKVRRGQIGNARAGRIPGGRSYGYRPVYKLDARGRPEGGWSEIDPEQADIVRRIFNEFLSGSSPIAIARRLNLEGVPSPRGGKWNGSTILGHRQRGNGILHNSLYAGRIVYNRQRFEKHPLTRRRVSKLNPREQWIETQVDELRIVDEATWMAAAERLAVSRLSPMTQRRRPKRLLSGLVECGECSGTITVQGNERWGCSTRRNTGTCNNSTTISTRELERRVIDALKNKMLTPEWVEEFMDEWRLLTNEENRRRKSQRAKIATRLSRVQGRIDRLVNAIADGLGYEETKAKLIEAYNERAQIEAEMAEHSAVDELVLHPSIALEYRRWVEGLQELLDNDEYDSEEVRASLRPHIGKVVMSPNPEGRGAILELHGVLAAMLQSIQKRPAEAGRPVSLVAGAGFEPATFRL